jgi:tRNA(adenine34) deaminase
MMRRAIALARSAALAGEIPVGAVVYRDGVILGEAANNREASTDPTGHAEVVAMRAAGERLGSWRLVGCSIAVTLEPCSMCAGALVNARMGRIVFGASDPKAGACGSLMSVPTDPRLNHRCRVVAGVLRGPCAEALRSFFRRRRAERRTAAAASR